MIVRLIGGQNLTAFGVQIQSYQQRIHACWLPGARGTALARTHRHPFTSSDVNTLVCVCDVTRHVSRPDSDCTTVASVFVCVTPATRRGTCLDACAADDLIFIFPTVSRT